jgi:hypothetical protein
MLNDPPETPPDQPPTDPLVALGAEELASRLRDLQQRVVQNSDTGRAPRPLWVHVMVATGFGSTSAHQLCLDAGEDPDAVWGEATLAHLSADRLPPDLLSSLLHQLDEEVLQDALHKLDADDYGTVMDWARAAWTGRVAEDAQLNVDEVPPPPPALTRLRDEYTDYWAAYSRSLDEDGQPPATFTAAAAEQAPEVSDG